MASSSSRPQTEYQIFLSFRGKDTRNGFTAHLLASLKARGFGTFFDEEKLERGEKLTPTLLAAIEASKISIIVASKDYASSNSCLIELSKIMECKATNGMHVEPIFYHVDPSDVRNLAEPFKEHFTEHQENRPDEVEKWKDAFTEMGKLKGWHIRGGNGDKSEPEYIEEIIEDVIKKLDRTSLHESKGLVGIDCQKDEIKSLLCIDEKDIRIIGIWGMGGMGKTTLAGAVYNDVRGKFDSCCFVGNVREESEKSARGIKTLRDQLLSKLLGQKDIRIDTPDVACPVTKDRLGQNKVLVVLDDVQDSNQLQVLLMGRDDYGSGSRIIVTSRDRQVLINEVDRNSIYEIQGLSDYHSLKLFSRHAFKQEVPLSCFENQSKTIVKYVKGNPLALKVLGGALYERGEDYWQDQLKTLIKGGPVDKIIDDALRISFNGLGDVEKDIFLDIACFFKGFYKEDAIKILDSCYQQGALRGITHLKDRTLLTIIEVDLGIYGLLDMIQAMAWNIAGLEPIRNPIMFESGRLLMHDLIQAMGWNIVRSEPIRERSRVWASDNAHEVLNNQSRNEAMKGIFLDTSQISKMELSPEVFTRMPNLRFLNFYNRPCSPDGQCTLSVQSLTCFPGYLRYLSWEHYPLKSFPSNFMPDYLVELRLPDSSLEQIWEGKKNLKNLRVIDLKGCKNLTKIPDLSLANNLERLSVDGCESLRELPSMVHLQFLEPNFHAKLCSKLNKFPELPQHLESLKLRNNEIKVVPESIKLLDQLEHLDLTGCSNLVEFPTSFKIPSTLTSLYLQGCKRLKSLPVLPVHSIDLIVSDCPSLRGVSGAQEFQCSGTFLSQNLRFGNCFNLDAEAVENIVADALLKIHGMANTWLKNQVMGRIEVIVAGCEISRRFKYQSTNSPMTHVKLLNPDEPIVRSLGFVPFVVIDCDGKITEITCRFELKTTGGQCHRFESKWDYHRLDDQDHESFWSNHVFIWFHDKLLQEDKNYEEAFFSFNVRGQCRNGRYDEIEVKKCGVHVFYADAERIIIDSEGESELINCDHGNRFCTSWAEVMWWLCSRP